MYILIMMDVGRREHKNAVLSALHQNKECCLYTGKQQVC